jgi:hypothetical protein
LGERHTLFSAVADDDMVVQFDVEEPSAVDELPRQAQVLQRRRGVTGRVVVNQDERRSPFADRRTQTSRGWTSEADCVPTDTSVCIR